MDLFSPWRSPRFLHGVHEREWPYLFLQPDSVGRLHVARDHVRLRAARSQRTKERAAILLMDRRFGNPRLRNRIGDAAVQGIRVRLLLLLADEARPLPSSCRMARPHPLRRLSVVAALECRPMESASNFRTGVVAGLL